MRTYESFIEDLRELRANIDVLRAEPTAAKSVPFKIWEHSLRRLIRSMRTSGYRNTGCQIEHRTFELASFWEASKNPEYFDAALDDTMIELDDVIAEYDTHGAPASSLATMPVALAAPLYSPARDPAPQLPKPSEITLDMLMNRVPFAYWSIGGGVVVAVATLAFGAGRAYEVAVAKSVVQVGDAPSKTETPARPVIALPATAGGPAIQKTKAPATAQPRRTANEKPGP